MAYQLGDVFIGRFPITQSFGARPLIYGPRYGLKGHNGIDFGCPTMTPLLSAADGWVKEAGFDSGGYGNYVKIIHDGFFTLYGHMNDITVKVNDTVVSGQLIGHSNNTGFSDGPHLHFGVAPCDVNGNKTEKDNGYSGYINPLGDRCKWVVKNLTAPVTPHAVEEDEQIPVLSSDFTRMVAEGTNYKVIAAWAVKNGINHFLSQNNLPTIDLERNPNDSSAGENIVKWLNSRLLEIEELRTKLAQPAPTTEETIINSVRNLPTEKRDSILTTLLTSVKGFIFK